MHVILPQQTHTQIGMQNVTGTGLHPTLYLLHGLSDDDSIWLRRTSIERYVADLGIAVVMPQVHRSFYTDMAEGGRYWTFISEELPTLARSFFPLSHQREDNFVAGLSMGGYGAFKLALRKPEQYAAAASLSGALDMVAHLNNTGGSALQQAEMKRIFGSQIAGQRMICFICCKRASKIQTQDRYCISAVERKTSFMKITSPSERLANRRTSS